MGEVSPDPGSWVQLADRYGVSLVMLAFVSMILVVVLFVAWRHFIVPTRDRELGFVDEVAIGLKTERESTRDALVAISKSVVAIEGYARSLDEAQRDLKQGHQRHHELLTQHDERLRELRQVLTARRADGGK